MVHHSCTDFYSMISDPAKDEIRSFISTISQLHQNNGCTTSTKKWKSSQADRRCHNRLLKTNCCSAVFPPHSTQHVIVILYSGQHIWQIVLADKKLILLINYNIAPHSSAHSPASQELLLLLLKYFLRKVLGEENVFFFFCITIEIQ